MKRGFEFESIEKLYKVGEFDLRFQKRELFNKKILFLLTDTHNFPH